MTYKQFQALVAKHKGWIEGDAAFFPTVQDRREFELESAGK